MAAKAKPALSAIAAMRPVAARRCHEPHALMATRTTTTIPATPTIDFNRAATETRDSMKLHQKYPWRMHRPN
jgi:hypothetical protein